jgi:hypothetical protein
MSGLGDFEICGKGLGRRFKVETPICAIWAGPHLAEVFVKEFTHSTDKASGVNFL